MTGKQTASVLCAVLIGWLATTASARANDSRSEFRSEVYPLLAQHCFRCHQGRDPASGVRLDNRDGIVDNKLAVPGRSSQSRLISLVASDDPDEVMPPIGEGRSLTGAELTVLRRWVDAGLSWDEELLPPLSAAESHWAFAPVRRPRLPVVENLAWLRSPVDAFVAAVHEAKQLQPLPTANRRVLIRRLYLDLLGIPPEPHEVDLFVDDRAADAWEQLVDRLLASPAYGQRWGRHWLDVARWAESEGYESNHHRPYAWRYRDYVVNSFNRDQPYDRFLREQIAGDEIEPYADEHLIATGFLAAARLSSNEEDKALQRNAVLVDIVNSVGSAVLGLTLQCAQCHDHKFDPISQQDYYALQAFFVRGQVNNLALQDTAMWAAYRRTVPADFETSVRRRDQILARAKRQTFAAVRQQLSAAMRAALDLPLERRSQQQQELARQADLKFQFTPKGLRRNIAAEDRKLFDELEKRIHRLQRGKNFDKPQTIGFFSPATSPFKIDVLPMVGFYSLPYEPERLQRTKGWLLVRGDVHRRGEQVDARPPEIFRTDAAEASTDDSRSALVAWFTDRSNPLTARVWVNRIWQHHFGRGLVGSAGDFGLRGERPTHPELLDWLAAELMEHGWSTKHVHRLILTSQAWQLAAGSDRVNESRDPANAFLWKRSARRLEAEALRDAMLAVAGRLDLAMGGDSAEDPRSPRRAIYLRQRRDGFPQIQRLFDGPTANESCSVRQTSTVALQPLFLLNGRFAAEMSNSLAERVRYSAGPSFAKQVDTAFQLALSRSPTAEEASLAADAFRSAPDGLTHLCHALINLNEFVYSD